MKFTSSPDLLFCCGNGLNEVHLAQGFNFTRKTMIQLLSLGMLRVTTSRLRYFHFFYHS